MRGFTLLEVMISLAILAIALVALSGLNGGAVAMHAYSRRATEATLLLRGKMLDVEEDLQKNGFSDFDDEKHGDFSDDGSPGYAWSAEVLRPNVQLDPAQLMSLLGAGQGQAGQASAGNVSGAASALAGSLLGGQKGGPQPANTSPLGGLLAGPIGGVMQTQATTFIETLKKSVREIRLTVSWPEGKGRGSISASQLVVILPESVGQTPNPAQPAQPQIPQPGQPGALRIPGTQQ